MAEAQTVRVAGVQAEPVTNVLLLLLLLLLTPPASARDLGP